MSKMINTLLAERDAARDRATEAGQRAAAAEAEAGRLAARVAELADAESDAGAMSKEVNRLRVVIEGLRSDILRCQAEAKETVAVLDAERRAALARAEAAEAEVERLRGEQTAAAALEAVAVDAINEFRLQYPFSVHSGDVARDLSALWRVVREWGQDCDRAREVNRRLRERVGRVRRSAVEYKRGIDFDMHQRVVERAKEAARLKAEVERLRGERDALRAAEGGDAPAGAAP